MYEDLINEISPLVEHLNDLVALKISFYLDFVDNVENNVLTDMKEIEWQLSSMLDFCFNDEVLALYKRVLRKLYYDYPDIVEFYVYAYRDMWN